MDSLGTVPGPVGSVGVTQSDVVLIPALQPPRGRELGAAPARDWGAGREEVL